jgi:Ser/Thr protein kinase RdoA (MazF antagonist)
MVLTWTVLAGLMSSPLYRLFLWAEKTVEEAYEQHILSRRSEWIARSMSRLLHGAKPGAEDAPLPVRKIMDPLKPELSEVLKHEWGLESVQQIGEPHKGKVFRMEDEDHAYAFKLSRTASSKSAGLEAILEQIEALNHEGLLRTPRVLSTRSGHLTGTFGSRAAYLMEWVHGRPIDSANVDEVGQLMRHLARLHLSTETPARSSQAIRARVLHVINGMRRRADIVLAQFSENRSSEERGDSVGLGVKRLAEDAIRAQLMARLSLLYVVESGEEDSLCLCHHDMHPMNCLITPAGELVMLDFDRMALGLGCEDLFSPMKRLVECHQWRFSIFEGVLDQYLAVRPLPRSEIALLLAYLYFPQRAMKGLAKDLAANRRGMAGKYAVRLLREGMLTASMDTLRRNFLQQAVKRYDVPLLGLTFTPVSGEELPAWIDAG